jgi:hypothetical protein
MHSEGALAEASDAGQDLVGRLGPAERPRLGIMPLDVGRHRRLQLLDRAVHAALEPLRRKSAKKRSTWLSQELAVGVKWRW